MKPFIQNKGGILAASITTEGFSLSLLGSHRQGGLADYEYEVLRIVGGPVPTCVGLFTIGC